MNPKFVCTIIFIFFFCFFVPFALLLMSFVFCAVRLESVVPTAIAKWQARHATAATTAATPSTPNGSSNASAMNDPNYQFPHVAMITTLSADNGWVPVINELSQLRPPIPADLPIGRLWTCGNCQSSHAFAVLSCPLCGGPPPHQPIVMARLVLSLVPTVEKVRTANRQAMEQIGTRIMSALKQTPLAADSPTGTKWEVLRASGLMVFPKPDFNASGEREVTPLGQCIEQLERRGWWIRHALGWSSVVSVVSDNLVNLCPVSVLTHEHRAVNLHARLIEETSYQYVELVRAALPICQNILTKSLTSLIGGPRATAAIAELKNPTPALAGVGVAVNTGNTSGNLVTMRTATALRPEERRHLSSMELSSVNAVRTTTPVLPGWFGLVYNAPIPHPPPQTIKVRRSRVTAASSTPTETSAGNAASSDSDEMEEPNPYVNEPAIYEIHVIHERILKCMTTEGMPKETIEKLKTVRFLFGSFLCSDTICACRYTIIDDDQRTTEAVGYLRT
jgi:hypothetical protein